MEILMSVIAGILFMAATYLLLSKSLLRVIIGTALLSHGVHLLLLTMGGLKKGAPPYWAEKARLCRSAAAGTHTDGDRYFVRRHVLPACDGVSRLSGTENGRYGSNEGK